MQYPLFCGQIEVLDPVTSLPVHLSLYRTEGGGLFALDSSFIEQVRTTIPSPFDDGVLLVLDVEV